MTGQEREATRVWGRESLRPPDRGGDRLLDKIVVSAWIARRAKLSKLNTALHHVGGGRVRRDFAIERA
jgi:hypothetical protein